MKRHQSLRRIQEILDELQHEITKLQEQSHPHHSGQLQIGLESLGEKAKFHRNLDALLASCNITRGQYGNSKD